MAAGTKPENSRLNPLYIIQALKEHTDEEHPMTASQISDAVNREFGYLSSTGSVVSASTVKRILEDVTDFIFPFGTDLENAELNFGYGIYCVMKKGDSFVPYKGDEGNGHALPVRYYYYESNLKKAELITLKNAVETYNYFSSEDVTDIVRKIIKLRPTAFEEARYFDTVEESQRAEDSRLLANIETMHDLIRRKRRAKITYCAYGFDKKLHPRPGYPRVVEPLEMMWGNGYYYLLTYNEKYQNTVSLRLDKITQIEDAGETGCHYVKNFDPVKYRFEHPVMYVGEKEHVELLVRETRDNYMMNMLMDTFGKAMIVEEADNEMLLQYLGRSAEEFEAEGVKWHKIHVSSIAGGIALWAMEYCNDCVVIKPEGLVQYVRENLELGLEYYKRK